MLSELDDTIRHLLTVEGQFDPTEVDISFEIPNRDWSKGISKPTINCYLFDIREHRDLRHSGAMLEAKGSNGASRRRLPMFVGLTYLITAWTRVVEDEHRLLFHALSTLMRFGVIPDQHVHGALRGHELPIHTQIAQPDGVLKSPGEFWTALENHLKPSINYLVFLALDFDRLPAGPPVLSNTVRFQSISGTVREEVLRFGGTLRDANAAPVVGAEVWVEGHRDAVRTDVDGRFLLHVPSPGRYTLVARGETGLQRRDVDVPANEFDLTLPGDDAPASRAKKTR
jgi:hypothetical protein